MKDRARERAYEIAKYIAEKKCTIREAAKIFKVSKSTVFRDICILRELGKSKEVDKVLASNKDERAIRGGLATKEKYLSIKNETNKA